jgi:hypothetical protein
MGEPKKNLSPHDVLCYRRKGASRRTVRRHYLRWRQEQDPPLPERCDNPDYYFYTNPLIWNGKKLQLILDHINGNNSDNRPKNLRLLCANCDSQLETRGGANKGRIEKAEGGFAQISHDGKRHHVLPVEPGSYAVSGQEVKLKLIRNSARGETAQQGAQPERANRQRAG